MKKGLKIVLLLFFINFGITLSGIEIKLEKIIQIKEDKDAIIMIPGSFTVGENEEIILIDTGAPDVKVFNSKGAYLYSFGGKGYGPGEFILPYTCYRNKKSLWISDIRSRKIIQYNLINGYYKYVNESRQTNVCYGLQVISNKIYIAGYKSGKDQEYSFYAKDLKNMFKTEYIIPRSLKFGSGNLNGKYHYSRYNSNGYFDIYKNHVYFVWSGDLRIIKLNLIDKSKKIFGHKTKNYIKPIVTKKFVIAHKERNSRLMMEIRKKYSFVGGVFVTPDYVGILYRGVHQISQGKYPVYVQFYSHIGEFKKEIVLDQALANPYYQGQFHYSKNLSKLYFKNTKEEDESYICEILVYKI